MGHLPVITDVYRCSFQWLNTSSGQKAKTVMHFKKGASTAAGVFADLDAHVTNGMWQTEDTATEITQVDIIKLDGVSATVSFATGVPARWKGNNAPGDFLVAPASLVKMQTGIRGPANRGRVFLPFPGEATVSDGQVTGAFVTAGQTAWAAFLTAMTTATCFPVVASYKHATENLVVAYVFEAALGTIKKRQERLRR